MIKFIIKKTVDKQFMFNLHAQNGEIILTSESYTTKQNCKDGIQSVKENAPLIDRFVEHEGIPENSRNVDIYYWFTLLGRNSQIIGKSEIYTTQQGMKHGINSVQRCAPVAVIKDRSSWFYNIF